MEVALAIVASVITAISVILTIIRVSSEVKTARKQARRIRPVLQPGQVAQLGEHENMTVSSGKTIELVVDR